MHPILFKLGPLTIYSYGVMVACAFGVTALLIRYRSPEFGIPRPQAMDLVIWVLVGGILGARALYILVNPYHFLSRPVEIFMLHHGGLIFFGGLGGGLIGAVLFIRKEGLSFADTSDLIASYIALGQAIGRIGCLLNGCCYGRPTNLPFGILFPGEKAPLHPTQIYESLACLAIFIFLLSLQAKRPFKLSIFLLYLILYSVFRFFNEYFRGDNLQAFLGLTLGQIIYLLLFFVGVVVYIKRLRRAQKV